MLRELTMKTTAIAVSRLHLPSWSRLRSRLPDFVALMKPRVMVLAVFTAFVGLMIAAGHHDPFLGSVATLAIAAGAGAAGVLNMLRDADIDGVMARTAMRPIPRGIVSRGEALVFGLILAGGAVAALAFAANVMAAALLAFAIFFYVVVYTTWLKRRTPQNIVIGGAAGALPLVIGWTVGTGGIAIELLILFLIIFLWTPPHFWALALNRTEEYARARVPMLPVVAGRAATTRQILIYSALLAPASLLPWALGVAGMIYGAAAAVCGAMLIALAVQLARSREDDRRAAHRLRILRFVFIRPVCSAVGRQRQPLVDHPLHARSCRIAVGRPVASWCMPSAWASASRHWTDAMVELPGVREDGMSGRNGSESPEPLVGRLGAPAQRRHRV